MAEQTAHTATTEAPKEGGFPPFDTTTFASQLFWLAIFPVVPLINADNTVCVVRFNKKNDCNVCG